MEKPTIYKLVCVDVDGTLVNDSKEVMEFTREQIERVKRDFDTTFVLVSSRMPKSLFALMKSLALVGPVVAYNGALVLKDAALTSGSDVLRSVYLPNRTLPAVHSAISTFGKQVHLGIFSNNIWNVKEIDYWALREARGTKIWPEVDEGLVSGVSTVPVDRLHKVIVRADKSILDQIESALVAMLPAGCETFRSNDTFVEISPTAALKSPAVSIIQDLLSTTPASTIAFGDNLNDIEMLRSAGLGIAMHNAPWEVKQICDEITLSNSEDGVGYSLKKYFPAQ